MFVNLLSRYKHYLFQPPVCASSEMFVIISATDNAAAKHPVKTDCCGKHAAETNISFSTYYMQLCLR